MKEKGLFDIYFSCIAQSEGYREGLYLCSESKMTIGFGRNLEANPFTKEDAEMMRQFKTQGEKDHAKKMHEAWCKKQIAQTVSDLEKWFSFFPALPDFAKVVLVDMTYNLNTKIKDFKKMISALEKNDFKTAAEELKNSDFYQQTGLRGKRLEQILKTGKIDV